MTRKINNPIVTRISKAFFWKKIHMISFISNSQYSQKWAPPFGENYFVHLLPF